MLGVSQQSIFFCSFVVSMDILTSTQLTKLIKQITETGEWDLDKDSLKVKTRILVLIKEEWKHCFFALFPAHHCSLHNK